LAPTVFFGLAILFYRHLADAGIVGFFLWPIFWLPSGLFLASNQLHRHR
jgi:hypothetical protein